jgi:hypothetical protein
VRYGPTDKFHIVSGTVSDGAVTYCSRFFAADGVWARRFLVAEPFGYPENTCISCRRASQHAANGPIPADTGEIPVSSGRLGTGKRRY